jgi:hypothetical protein
MEEERKVSAKLDLGPFLSFLLETSKMLLETGWSTNLNLSVSLYMGESKIGSLKFEGVAKIEPVRKE